MDDLGQAASRLVEAPREGLELVPLPNEVAVVVVLRRRGEAVAWDFFLVQSVVRVEEIVRYDWQSWVSFSRGHSFARSDP